MGFHEEAGRLQFLQDFQDAVAAFDRLIEHKPEPGRVFQDHSPGHQALDAFAAFLEHLHAFVLLRLAAEDADEDGGVFQVGRHFQVVDVDQAGFMDGEFTADDRADLAFQ